MPTFGAALFAGGKSRRMGSDKAALLYEGKPFLYHIAQELDAFPEKLLSVEMYLSSYTGGAHGNNGFIPVNFDSNGELITHEDLYIISDPTKAVAEIITDKLKKGETDLAGLGAEMFYSTETQDFAEYLDPDDFILTGEGVKIIYQPYAIAPFAAGAPTFLLTWEELDGIANNEWK